MNAQIWKQYGARFGKILSNYSVALFAVLLCGALVTVSLSVLIIVKALIGAVLIICSLGLLLLKDGFSETMFSANEYEALESVAQTYLACLPALAFAALAFSAVSTVLLISCEPKGARSVGRIAFSCLTIVVSLIALCLLCLGGSL